MKNRNFVLGASIAAALAVTPALSMAQPAFGSVVGTGEGPRVIQTIDNTRLFTIPKSHPLFVTAAAAAAAQLPDSTRLNHLQLVLKPSMARKAEMEKVISSLHDPRSARFQKWLTPVQFGSTFGVSDADIASVVGWLTSQGFTVNNVYPNKTQIDFSGSAGQLRQAFHTQENVYTVDGVRHLANASDIAIPAALKPVVVGVMGLNDMRPDAFRKKVVRAQWNKSKGGLVIKPDGPTATSQGPGGKGQAVSLVNGTVRGLVPNDLATMYGIKQLRANGVTGSGVTIAVVEDNDMNPADWTNFVGVFNLARYGGTFNQMAPQPASGSANCQDPDTAFQISEDDPEALLDAEWATAIAPGAHVVVAACSDYNVDDQGNYTLASDNFFGGVFLAASNLVNGSARPDIISASYGYGEYFTDTASKVAIDLMWAQADAEGISVFVSTGDSGSNPSFNGSMINSVAGNPGVDANSFASSPHVTAVGGTDTADILDGTTSKYFAAQPSVVGGSALSYVPEIPWNESCGNGVAAKAKGYNSAITFCQNQLYFDPLGYYPTSEAASGGPSSVEAKPEWQTQVFNAAKDSSRDLPDVALFAGSYGEHTFVVVCTHYEACTPDFSGVVGLSSGTSLSTPMFAGIQALMDQGLAARGMQLDQGNAAPTLYALAATEYGTANGPAPASLAACNSDHGTQGSSGCIFHNITRGTISSQCHEEVPEFVTSNCYIYGEVQSGELYPAVQLGLTTSDTSPTHYSSDNKAFSAQPGWSFAAGLGSVDARNLLIAWRAFVNAPPATVVPR